MAVDQAPEPPNKVSEPEQRNRARSRRSDGQEVTPAGNQPVVTGSYDVGLPTAGPATSSLLHKPYAVAVDGSGNLCIADNSNSVVETVTSPQVGTPGPADRELRGSRRETVSRRPRPGCPSTFVSCLLPDACAASGRMGLSATRTPLRRRRLSSARRRNQSRLAAAELGRLDLSRRSGSRERDRGLGLAFTSANQLGRPSNVARPMRSRRSADSRAAARGRRRRRN